MIALVTCAAGPGLDPDEEATVTLLAEMGYPAEIVSWESERDWSSYELVVIRSTWDYHEKLEKFTTWAKSVALLTRLCNPLAAVLATLDKSYLSVLESNAVPVVPTVLCPPGETAQITFDSTEYVVKPTVSAGSNNTFRVTRGELDQRIDELHAKSLTAMVQPYIATVDERGETGMVFLGGKFSHAFRKGPMLAGPADMVDGLYKAENISGTVPSDKEIALAQLCLAAAPSLGFDSDELLYARVDVVEVNPNDYRVLEFEVIEPSLFLAYGDGATQRFAEAIVSRITNV